MSTPARQQPDATEANRPDVAAWAERVPPQPAGSVSLVGAGPGDPLLISVKGAARLAQADVVLYDGLVNKTLLDLVSVSAETRFVGKRAGAYCVPQDETHRLLIEHAKAGRRVVRLKGGDPFVFGRGAEECIALADAGIPFEVVPGITAAIAAPAYAGIPMTHRGTVRTFAVVTGHADPTCETSGIDFHALAKIGTVAFYMGHLNLRANCAQLIKAGMAPDTPAVVIQSGTNPDQRTVLGTLHDIADKSDQARLHPPCMVLIGPVVELREHANWFESRPLFGKRILITRSADQASALAAQLAAQGAEVVEAPTIRIQPIDDPKPVENAIKNVSAYDWLILTSANGVDALLARLDALRLDARALAGVKIGVVGSATAHKLTERFIRPDLVPESFVADKLADQLIDGGNDGDIAGKRILLLRADIARPDLPRRLTEAGAICDDIPIYRTVRVDALPPDVLEDLRADRFDWITFTSGSTFRNLVSLFGQESAELLRDVRLASIGPVTTKAIRHAGFAPAVEATDHTIPGLVDAILAYESRS